MQPCQQDSRSFFEKLQSAEDLDLRDNRGKRHGLAIVLVGVTLAVLSNRDGNLSSIHRHPGNHYKKLMTYLELEKKSPISRAQLPRVLEKVAVEVFDDVIFAQFGIRLNEKEKDWFAVDGKELRGSIESGEKRGEALVQVVGHANQQTVRQDYYSGEKESEVPVVRSLLNNQRLASQKISMDALHCKPLTLEIIVAGGGKYLVGLKENQKELKKQVSQTIQTQAVLWKTETLEKGHGRIEYREYEFYDLLEMNKADRWNELAIRTGIKVKRTREDCKSGKSSQQESYYLTNEIGNYEELSQAVRLHWQVETNNHLRDVSLREDEMRSKKRNYSAQWEKSEPWQQ
jgi:predicted transposase YbfD/YdcC